MTRLVAGRMASVKPAVPTSASAGTTSSQARKSTGLCVRRNATQKSMSAWPPMMPASMALSASLSRSVVASVGLAASGPSLR